MPQKQHPQLIEPRYQKLTAEQGFSKDSPKVEFNGSMRHFFGRAQDEIFRLIDKKEAIRDVLKEQNHPFRESILNHVLMVVRQIRDSLLQRGMNLADLFPKKKETIGLRDLDKENENRGNESRGNEKPRAKRWMTTAITFMFVLVNKLSIQEEEVNKLIYLFRLEGSQDVDLNVIQKWLRKDSFVHQYFDYYLVASPKAYEE